MWRFVSENTNSSIYYLGLETTVWKIPENQRNRPHDKVRNAIEYTRGSEQTKPIKQWELRSHFERSFDGNFGDGVTKGGLMTQW
jgi:hypothetical protein